MSHTIADYNDVYANPYLLTQACAEQAPIENRVAPFASADKTVNSVLGSGDGRDQLCMFLSLLNFGGCAE